MAAANQSAMGDSDPIWICTVVIPSSMEQRVVPTKTMINSLPCSIMITTVVVLSIVSPKTRNVRDQDLIAIRGGPDP